MNTRLVALVTKSGEQPKVRHFIGMPPEAVKSDDLRQELPAAQVLLIEEKPDGVFLSRFAEAGGFAGDTWHRSLDEAKAQGEFEYEVLLTEWREVPSDVVDPVAFALGRKPESL